MSNDLSIRIGDAERDVAARELAEHYAAGRLDSDEFESRLELANRARTRGDLVALMRDLPGRQRSRPRRSGGRPHVPVLLVVAAVAIATTFVLRGGPPPFFLIPLFWLFVFRPWRRRRWTSA